MTSSVSPYTTTVAPVTPNQLSPSAASIGFGARTTQTMMPVAKTAPAVSSARTASDAGPWLRATTS